MRSIKFVAFLVLLLSSNLVPAQQYVWMIGGGPLLENSQAQIELNTKWVQQLIAIHKPDAISKVYFTDGDDPKSDVKVRIEIAEDEQNLQPLARVFDEKDANSTHFYSHTVPQVFGPTDADFIRKDLAQDFARVKKGDEVTLIFQGHGGINPKDTAQNSFKLWNNTRLSVQQLEKLLQTLDPSIPVRFMFPQCFSGGFSRLIYPDADRNQTPSSALRCGFMAEYDFEESEGCTTSINEADYRDYSSYFFAALDGKNRDNRSLSADPDRDRDGRVSLQEAHFYSLTQAISADVPRSTSETFLQNWIPWYLRWLDGSAIPDNIYSQLAKEVAIKNQYILQSNGQIKGIKQHIAQLQQQRLELDAELQELIKNIAELKQLIAEPVIKQWPYIEFANTKNYFDLMNNQLDNIQTFIQQHKDYPRLVKSQNRIPVLEKKLLEVKRKITQIQKINRLNTLARIYQQFTQRANLEDKQVYERLVQCESMSF